MTGKIVSTVVRHGCAGASRKTMKETETLSTGLRLVKKGQFHIGPHELPTAIPLLKGAFA